MLVFQVLASAGTSAGCTVSRLKKMRNIYFCCGAAGIVDSRFQLEFVKVPIEWPAVCGDPSEQAQAQTTYPDG